MLEEEEDTIIVANSLLKNRTPIDEMFKLRDSEGFYEVLINRHLKNNDIKFRKFFLINYQQFDFWYFSVIPTTATAQFCYLDYYPDSSVL